MQRHYFKGWCEKIGKRGDANEAYQTNKQILGRVGPWLNIPSVPNTNNNSDKAIILHICLSF